MQVALVSIVIPLYNAEKYLADCLESLLSQTFQNFEVIIVDDCSTDSSCTIVESYREKFGGRLTFSRLEKNSGSGALPRNKGLKFSRGEYIFFADADDMFTKTALEELYTLAKNFDADVVYCEKVFQAELSKISIISTQQDNFVDKPTFETEHLSKRFKELINARCYWSVTPWCKLVRRNLLIEHEIYFPHCAISEDDIWTYGLVFYAKKFLRVPNLTYIHRLHDNSVLHKKKTPQQNINFWLSPIILGLKTLDRFMSKLEFFQANPQYRYAVLEMLINAKFGDLFQESFKLPPVAIYETIKQEFGKNLGEQDFLVSLLCTYIINLQKTNTTNIQKLNQFAVQAQQRIAQLEAELGKKT